MFNKMTEEELNEWRLNEFYDALKYGTREEVIECLKMLESLNREYIEILVQQLENSTPPQQKFLNTFRLVSPRGKPPSIAAMPPIRDSIFRYYRQCREKGLSYKQAIFETEKKYEIKRTLIMKIVSEAKLSQK